MSAQQGILRSKFAQISAITTLGLILVFLVLVYVNFNIRLHVKSVDYIKVGSEAEISNQVVRINFNLPVSKENLREKISLTPEADFEVIWSGRSILVVLGEPLQSASEYTLKLDPSLTDYYGKAFAKDYSYKLKTRSQKIIFLQKVETAENSQGKKDKIISANLEGEEEVLYEANNISKFAKQGDSLVVIAENSKKLREVRLVSLDNDEVQVISGEDMDASALEFLPNSPELFFLAQDMERQAGPQGDIYVPTWSKKLWKYNINNKQIFEIDLGSEINDIEEFLVSGNGRQLLVKDSFNSRYYLINIGKYKELNPLGSFLAAGNFSQKGTKIIFMDINSQSPLATPTIVGIDSEKNKKNFSKTEDYSIDPKFISDDKLVFSRRYLEQQGKRTLFEAVILDETLDKEKIIRSAEYSLELAKPSIDKRYIVFEGYALSQTALTNSRFVSFQSKPNTAVLFIYNIASGELTETDFQGIEAVWE